MIDFMVKGAAVEGTYMGTPFTGTVSHARWHSLNHRTIEVTVEMAPGWTYEGQPRTSAIVSVEADGSNSDTYNGVGGGDSIRVAA